MSRRARLLPLLLAAGFLVGLLPDLAEGQYFGRNKVQYQSFDFSVLETEHFDIYYYEREREAAVQAGRMAERWYARLSRILDHDLRGRQPIVLYGSHPAFEQTNAVFGQIGETTGGVTEPLKRRIVLPLGVSMKETDHVLGHELVHAFQFDLTGQGPDAVGLDLPVALRMPLWFIEGMAEYLSIGSEDAFTAEWLRGAVMADELPSWGEMAKPRYFPYRYGHALWSYVGGRFGDESVGQLLKAATRTADMGHAFTTVLGLLPDSLIADWHASVREVQGPVLAATREASSYGREIAGEATTDTKQNLAPSLSPDGELVVFASEKNLFSMELFVAQVRTGEILRKLTETARDPHFESLQWVGSTGEWSRDGQRFVLAGVTRGRPVISIFDPRSGDRLRDVRLARFGEIFNPTWSPDGRRIAFSAQTAGFTDLHVLDLETGEVRTLTEDAHADLHPVWSPVGERIAFVTDRFGADPERLVPGPYRLATIDARTGEIEPIPAASGGKQINPQWGPEGEELFYLSDRTGITNLYRYELDSGRTYRVTNLKTGISGISGLSPSLSVARDESLAVFSIHGEGNFVFTLHALEGAEQLTGEPVSEETEELAGLHPAALPPVDAHRTVDRLLADEDVGLANALTFEHRDYSPGLSLDFLGRPSLAVGSDQFGFFVGGGGSAYFSDMLGNRSLTTLVQVDGSTGDVLKSTALYTSYVNRANRWNWGLVGGQIPLISRRFYYTPVSTSQGPAFLFQDFRFWQINREMSGVVEFPFNRVQRVEFSAGLRNVEFSSEVRETLYSAYTGQEIFQRDVPYPALDTLSSLYQARTSAALVYDNAIFGATAPMVGQRYRLEVSPTFGSIDYYTLLADFRRYLMPVRPLTIAGRALHAGRYGGGSEDHRLQDYFIGYSSLVRGYEPGTFTFQECAVSAPQPVDDVNDVTRQTNLCPAFDQLIGSRIGVANLELRLPFIGGIGLLPAANVPPVDLIAFFDAGIAWSRDVDPTWVEGGEREFVRSVGVGGRVNLFGLAVFEIDYVNPLDRPRKDWFWTFSVTPGF